MACIGISTRRSKEVASKLEHEYVLITGSGKVCIPKTTIKSKTNTMYHMHTLGAFKCMHVVHTGGFRCGGGFGYTYLTSFLGILWELNSRELSSEG